MFSETFASIAAGFSGLAGGPFYDGLLKWPGTPTLDSGGSITSPGTPTEEACKVQVDVVTEAMRQDASFQDRDVRLLILAGGLDSIPDEAARLEVLAGPNAGTYAIASVTRDPAGVGYECRGRIDRQAEFAS